MKIFVSIFINILIFILIVTLIIISFKWCIKDYVIMFFKNENLNLELGLPSDSYILFLKTNRWADTVRDFDIIYFQQYEINYLKEENTKIDNASNLYMIEDKNMTGFIFFTSIILLVFYFGLLFILLNYNYTKKELKKIE